jgi:flavin-dependent dehydrogenase
VRLIQHGRSARIRARAILTATGLGHCVVPGAGVPLSTVTVASRIGAGCRIAQPASAFAERVVYMAVGAGGYVGMVRVEDGSLNVAAAFDAAFVRRVRTPGAAACEILREAGAPEIEDLAGALWQGTPGLTRRTRPLAQDRLFCLGDAASYVEPFTGEGIGWALASARAVEPIALRAIERWEPRLAQEWARAHRRLTGRRQLVCRAIALGLRQPWLMRLGLEILDRAPVAANGVMRVLNQSLAYSNAS